MRTSSRTTTHKPKWRFAWGEPLGLPECPYVIRWIAELPWCSVRVHHWLGPDDSRAFHDHPWWFLTFVVKGCYGDQTPDPGSHAGYKVEFVKAPAVRFRPALHRHTVVPSPDGGAWTVLVTGRIARPWGFWPGGKFVKANKWFLSRGHHPCSLRYLHRYCSARALYGKISQEGMVLSGRSCHE